MSYQTRVKLWNEQLPEFFDKAVLDVVGTEAPHEIEVPGRRATWTVKPPTRAAAPRRSGRGRSTIATPRGRRQA